MPEFFIVEVREMVVESYLPLLIVLIPIIGSVLISLAGLKSPVCAKCMAVTASGLSPYLSVELFLTIMQGYTVFYLLPALAGIAMSLKIDLTDSVFCLFSTIVWFLAIFALIPFIIRSRLFRRTVIKQISA